MKDNILITLTNPIDHQMIVGVITLSPDAYECNPLK